MGAGYAHLRNHCKSLKLLMMLLISNENRCQIAHLDGSPVLSALQRASCLHVYGRGDMLKLP